MLRKQAAESFAKKRKSKDSITKDVGRVGVGTAAELASVPLIFGAARKKRKFKIKGLALKARARRLGRGVKGIPSEAVKRVKGLPKYIAKHPSRFGAGLGLKAAGGYITARSLLGLGKRLRERESKRKK